MLSILHRINRAAKLNILFKTLGYQTSAWLLQFYYSLNREWVNGIPGCYQSNLTHKHSLFILNHVNNNLFPPLFHKEF